MNCSEKMKDFLNYIAGKETDGALSERLRQEVTRSKEMEQWRLDYMTLTEKYREKLEEGKQLGIQIGKQIGEEKGLEKGAEERKQLIEENATLRAEIARLQATIA